MEWMTKSGRPACGLLVAATFLGCGPDGSPPDVAAVSDSAGVEIVMNQPGGTLGDLALREDLRLGVFEGEGPEQFAGVFAADINESGQIFVGNDATATVRVFDRDGSYLAELGGRGSGPGEVSMVNDLLVTGDTVGIVDWQRGGKIPFYTLDGTLLTSLALRREDGARFMPLHPAPDGWFISVSSSSGLPQLARGDSSIVTQDVLITGLEEPDLDATPIFTMPGYPLYGTSDSGEGSVDWGLFRALPSVGFDAEGRFYSTAPREYRIDIHDENGLVKSIRRDWDPRLIGPEDVQALRSARAQVYDTLSRINEDSRDTQRQRSLERIDRQASLPIPGVMSPLTGMMVSADGSFWVQVADPETLIQREIEGSFGGFGGVPSWETRWELFDPEGRLLGGVKLPARYRPEAVSGREVVGVWLDEFDVEYVIRYVAEPRSAR